MVINSDELQAKSPMSVYIMFSACIQTLVHPMRSKGIQSQGHVSVCIVYLLINVSDFEQLFM